MSDQFTKSFSLCWGCKRATTGGCSWSSKLEPVDGWSAEKKKNSWQVNDCPLFVANDEEKQRYTDDGVLRVLEAMLRDIGDTYIHTDSETLVASLEASIKAWNMENVLPKLRETRNEYQLHKKPGPSKYKNRR